MTEVVSRIVLLQLALLLIHYNVPKSLSRPDGDIISSYSTNRKHYTSFAYISPSRDLQSLARAQAPSPLMPFTYKSIPKLSGLCEFNFSSAGSVLKVTATDCWSSLAPYLANAVCCPQYQASLVILLGQSSSNTGMLALNETHATHCISDVDKILESQGANDNLHKLCSTGPSNLTGASCPIIDANEVDGILASSGLVATCDRIDMDVECCDRLCQNAISAAAKRLTLRNHSMTTLSRNSISTEDSDNLSHCSNVVLRWLATKLDPSTANRVLRGLSSCNVNEGCPLVFPDISRISDECQIPMKNQTSCCDAMANYMSQLQEQSFITNLQASNCAALLSMKLQSVNVSSNIYNLCHINLKDFSLQVDAKESGCLLPSMPFDVNFDESSGIGFICDLNDNVEAPWPSGHFVSSPSCNKSSSSNPVIPELPKATSNQRGLDISYFMLASLFSISLIR